MLGRASGKHRNNCCQHCINGDLSGVYITVDSAKILLSGEKNTKMQLMLEILILLF